MYVAAALITAITLIVLELHQFELLRRLSEPPDGDRHD
jgi:hypothetical protein